jgi:hypothetical protein
VGNISMQQDGTQQPISDDQELAQALAGVLPEAQQTQSTIPPVPTFDPAPAVDTSMQFQETPLPSSIPPVEPMQSTPVYEEPVTVPVNILTPAAPATDLEGIKKDALLELRPLIDKVSLPSEEKFDTYLMLIRSTDDASLIGPAHAAAQSITDETRRAEALLDIIKEIDYLSHSTQQ